MSNRLESLSGKPPGAKTSLKFKPKTNVARRSQEERARDAPTVKTEAPSKSHQPPRRPMKGRPGNRQPYAGTHLVSSGLLSTGSVPIGGSKSAANISFRSSIGSSSLPTPEFLQARASKLQKAADSDGEEIDFTRIDMGSAYDFENEDTLLFPVRAPRSAAEDPINVPSATPSAAPSASPAPDIKREPSDDTSALSNIKTEESTEVKRIVEPQTSVLEAEVDRLDLDHDKIRAFLEGNLQSSVQTVQNAEQDSEQNTDATPLQNNYFLMHMPAKLPQYEEEVSEATEESEKSEIPLLSLSAGPYPPQGQIGAINVHKSGKITVTLGEGIILDVVGASEATFLQEIALLNLNPEVGEEEMKEPAPNELLRMGQVDRKLVVVPSL